MTETPNNTPGSTSVRDVFATVMVRNKLRWRLLLAVFFRMMHAFGETMIPVIIGVVIDAAVVQKDSGALITWLLVLVLSFVVLSTGWQGFAWVMVRVEGMGAHHLRQQALGHLLHPRLLKRTFQPGEALSYVTSDAARVSAVASRVAAQASTVTAIVVTAIVMMRISLPLAVAVFVATGLTLVIMQRVASPIENRGHDEQRAAAWASEVASDMMSGLRVLVGMRAQRVVVARYRDASQSSRKHAVRAGRSLALYGSLADIFSGVVLAGLATYAAWLASHGDITIGELVTVLGLAQFITGYLAHVGTFPTDWMHRRASAKRLVSMLNTPTQLAEAPAANSSTPVGEWRLRYVDPASGSGFEVNDGEVLGVRVSSVAAARELTSALGARRPLAPGQLLLNPSLISHVAMHTSALDATELDPTALRAVVASLPHRAQVLSGPLRELVLGLDAEPEEQPQPNVVSATAVDDVLHHVGSWDTQLGEAARRLSGGQRQRVMLARALHSEAAVVVLDEPTSAVDAMTEQHIAQALKGLGRTIVVVSSSPIVLSACDRVVTLDASSPELPQELNEGGE